jgi:hypothetical protein
MHWKDNPVWIEAVINGCEDISNITERMILKHA